MLTHARHRLQDAVERFVPLVQRLRQLGLGLRLGKAPAETQHLGTVTGHTRDAPLHELEVVPHAGAGLARNLTLGIELQDALGDAQRPPNALVPGTVVGPPRTGDDARNGRILELRTLTPELQADL